MDHVVDLGIGEVISQAIDYLEETRMPYRG